MGMPRAGALLAAENLSWAAGGRLLFDNLSVTVRAADLVEVRGPNGSGKSTLLRCLAGLLAPQTGRVARRCAIDYVGHRPGVCERMTAVENLRWLARLRGFADCDPRAALDAAGLGAARHDACGALSAGQTRRAALARLPLGAANVWLLDEPLAALDDSGAGILRGLLASHRQRGGAAVCATHRSLGADAGAPPLPARRIVRLGA